MTSQELEVLKQVLGTAGNVGAEGFASVVRYTHINAVIVVISSVLVLVSNILVVIFALRTEKVGGDSRVLACLTGLVLGAIAIVVAANWLPDVFEPQGSAVRDLVNMATRSK